MVRLVLVLTGVIILGHSKAEAQINAEVIDVLHLQEASYQLTRIQQLIADPQGGAWVLDSQTDGVIRFTESGEMLTFGRKGSGPGEFQRPWRMSLVRDTLWVVDLGLDRASGLDPHTGEPLGTINGGRLWRGLPEASGKPIAPMQVTQSGVLLAVEEPETASIALILLGRDEPWQRQELLRLERSDDDLLVEVPGHSEPIRITNPFSNSDLLALDNRGKYVARVRQRPSFEVEVVGLDGEPEHSVIPWALKRREVASEERVTWLTTQEWSTSFVRARFFPTETAATDAIKDALKTGLTPVVRRQTLGMFEQATFIDGQGGPWFEGWSIGDVPRRWYRLSPEGLDLEFTLESGELLLDVAGRFLWKQRVNSMGVPQLTRVELARSEILP